MKITPISTRDKIIQAALEEFLKKGFSGFTQHAVADRLGISPGNLTYHFKSRDDLIEAMIDKWFNDWKAELEVNIKSYFNSQRWDFDRFIDWVMKSALKKNNVRIFTELWAIGNHRPRVARKLTKLYDLAVNSVLDTLDMRENIHATEELRSLLYALAAISEGAAAVLGNSPRTHPQRTLIIHQVQHLFAPAFQSIIKRRL